MKETFENSKPFEPGELMSWQEMSRLLQDFKTRLDDLEMAVGDMTPEIEYELATAGTHPPNCRCTWCEPGDGSAWGSC